MTRVRATAVVSVATAATLAATALPAAATAAPTPAPSAPSASAEPGCRTGSLPAVVLGSPRVDAGDRSGTYVWHDATGWHLRVTHPGSAAVVFTGTVRATRPISARGYRLEPQDSFTLSADRETLHYRLVNHGRVDGLDFTDACALRTAFSLQRGGRELSPAEVYLGARKAHPTSNPFVVERR